jgi:tetratricopeptide (TPR) repeat protein
LEDTTTLEEKNVFDSLDFDEIAEIKALTRSIIRAEHFSLLFARSNQRPRQKELIEKIKTGLPGKKIEVVYFENEISNLLDELRGRFDEKPDAVFVYGLETSMPKSEIADKTPFVLNLNASRNAFPAIIDCPIVFWLPDYAIKAIMNGAPDFFSVRSGVFFFENDEELTTRQISEAVSSGYKEHDALFYEERQQRIKNLEELLAEYRSLPQEKRDLEAEYHLKDRLADIYDKTANYSKAEQLLKEVLEDIGQDNDNRLSQQLNNLALVYDEQGKYAEAIELYKQAMEIDEKTIGKEHPNYAVRLNNLANVYRSQGKYDEAIELFKQAMEIDEKTIGKEHSDYATDLSNLAHVYQSQGKYDEAIELYKQAMEIDEKTIGKEHPNYAVRLNNLAGVYRSQGKYDEAIELYKQVLEIGEKTIGKEHPVYATHLNNLAHLYESQGKYGEASDLFKEALRIFEKTLPENHPHILQLRRRVERVRELLEKK